MTDDKDRASWNSEASRYLQYLPAIYSEDEFMGRFLNIFESILGPIENVIDQVQYYFDPWHAPDELLPWLASWVDLVLDESWPVEKRRELITSAVQLYQLRGTRRGLVEYLRIYTGEEPEISEHFGGLKIGGSQLGWTAVLGDGKDHCVSIALRLKDPSAVDVQKIRRIIEIEKPAHVRYTLTFVYGDQEASNNGHEGGEAPARPSPRSGADAIR